MKFKVDLQLLLPAALLSVLGSFVIWSVNPDLIVGHLLSVGIGVVLFLVISQFNLVRYQMLWPAIYILLAVGLVAVFGQPAIRGSHRWIVIGEYTIQVAELGKPALAFVLAGFASIFLLRTFRNVVVYLILGFVPAFMVMKQPDLGNAILYLVMILTMMFAGYVKYRYLLYLVLIGTLLLPLGWSALEGYQQSRIVAFVQPDYDPQGIGYNATQALIAVGSGGLSGKGLGQGTQSHLRFLPESHTDFIFASLTEELGFIGSFVLLGLYAVLFYRLLVCAMSSKSIFNRLFLIGIYIQLFIQTVVNVGMNLGLVPITGVTLPLVSFGGSSVVVTFISLGMAQAVFQSERQDELLIR